MPHDVLAVGDLGGAPRACGVQEGGEVACWGTAVPGGAGVVSQPNASAASGRAFLLSRVSVCVGAGFVAGLAGPDAGAGVSVVSVGGAAVLSGPLSKLWCARGRLCALRASTVTLECYNVSVAPAVGAVTLARLALPAEWTLPPLAVYWSDTMVCALLSNGTASCAPDADGSSGDGAVIAPVGPLVSLGAGGADIVCGVLAAGLSVACWRASNESRVLLPAPAPAGVFSSVCVGAAGFACGLANASGEARCWRTSSDGSSAPPALQPGATFAAPLACGLAHVCGTTVAGVTVCSGGAEAAPACPPVSAAAPPACFGLTATAVDDGRAEGISAGDVVEVAVSRPRGNCTPGAAVAFSAPLPNSWSEWVAGGVLARFVVGDASSVDIDGTRVGALEVTPTAGAPCTGPPLAGVRPLRVGGSWGPHHAPRLLRAVANDTGGAPGLSVGDTVTLTFDMQTNRVPVGAANVFSAPVGTTASTWVDAATLRLTVLSTGGAGASGATRIGALSVAVPSSLALLSRDLSSAPSNATVVVTGSWGNSIARVTGDSVDYLTTEGGQLVVFHLSSPIGSGASAIPVSVSYSDGRNTYDAKGCAFDDAGGAVTCTTAPGVGAGFAWRLETNGVVAGGGAPAVYAAPVLTGAAPSVIGTDYAGVLEFTGREFGSAAEDAVDWVDLVYPGALVASRFGTTACHVNVSQTTIHCRLVGGIRGPTALVELRIGGQSTASVSLQARRPIVTAVAVVPDGGGGAGPVARRSCAPALCTHGGDRVRINGTYFGPATTPDDGTVSVSCTPLGGGPRGGAAFVHSGCAVVVPHLVIECTTSAAGVGAGLLWEVSVLGQAADAFESHVSYAAPVLFRITGPAPAVGSVRQLEGTDLGVVLGAAAVTRVLLDGGALSLAPIAAGVNGSLDVITVAVPPGTGLGHSLSVVVGGLTSLPVAFGYAAPVVTAAGLLALDPARRRWEVLLSGVNFGGTLGDVTVTVGGAACALDAVADATVTCWAAVPVGNVTVVVGGQPSRGPSVVFNASVPVATPLLSSISSAAPAPLAGGAVLTIAGSGVVPAAPSVALVLALDAPLSVERQCAMARALRAGGASSNWCTLLAVQRGAGVVTCVTPPWPRARVSLTLVAVGLTSCAASSPYVVVCAPVVVASVTPLKLPTAGGVVFTVVGQNIEEGTAVVLGGALCITLSRNTTVLRCRSPPGAGVQVAVATVSLAYGMRVQAGLRVAYGAPRIVGVWPAVVDTAGGAVTLYGADFSSAPVVTLGDGGIATVLLTVSLEHDTVTVWVPPGVGRNMSVSLVAGGQATVAQGALAYAAPVITAFNASVGGAEYVDGASGGRVFVLGRYFGSATVSGADADVRVTLGDYVCARTTVLMDTLATCTLGAGLLVGHDMPLVLSRAGQASAPLHARVACRPGFYGGLNETCRACPPGALCVGLDADPAPQAGYARLDRAVFSACIPPGACVALPAAMTAARLAAGADAPAAYANCADGYLSAPGDVMCTVCADHWCAAPPWGARAGVLTRGALI